MYKEKFDELLSVVKGSDEQIILDTKTRIDRFVSLVILGMLSVEFENELNAIDRSVSFAWYNIIKSNEKEFLVNVGIVNSLGYKYISDEIISVPNRENSLLDDPEWILNFAEKYNNEYPDDILEYIQLESCNQASCMF